MSGRREQRVPAGQLPAATLFLPCSGKESDGYSQIFDPTHTQLPSGSHTKDPHCYTVHTTVHWDIQKTAMEFSQPTKVTQSLLRSTDRKMSIMSRSFHTSTSAHISAAVPPHEGQIKSEFI